MLTNVITNVLLISPNSVKQITNLGDNLNGKLLEPAIREAGNSLRDVLGDRLTDKLEDLVYRGDIDKPENEKYKDLLNRCQYYLAYTTAAIITIFTYAKVDNQGVNTATDEHVNSLSLTDTYSISSNYQRYADSYCYKIQNFLLNNKSSYPELTSTVIREIKSNLYSAATCGLWLGGERNPKGGVTRSTYLEEKYNL